MIVPSHFDHFQGYISPAKLDEYCCFNLSFGQNYYNQKVKVVIDMMELSVTVTDNKSINVKQNLKYIDDDNQLFCAFSLMNPYAEFEIIHQKWVRRPNVKYSDKNVPLRHIENKTIKYFDDTIIKSSCNNENNSNSIAKSILPSRLIQSGVNYVGKCDYHNPAICNRGCGEEIDPQKDYFRKRIKCNQCNSCFKYEAIILHDCAYQIEYAINGDVETEDDVAYPDYIDVINEILKCKSYSYLSITADYINEF